MSKQAGRMSQGANDFLAPYAPTIGTATDVGTGRAYNNGAATVTFTAAGPNPATSYTVTSSPGGYTATGASSPITVTGLQSNTSYTFTVTGTNAAGTGDASSASNSITATTVPQAPSISSVADVGTNRPFDNGAATVNFSAGATGGKAITSYTATASAGPSASGSSSPITVGGLASASVQTFTVTATNANGTSSASAASSGVSITTVPATPSAPSASTVANQAQDSVSWSAPANGGKAITNYYWTSSDGKSGNTGSTSVTVSQEQGTAQTYNVRADNANGVSGTSSNSGSVTTFSFTPFGFAPFGAFGFTPFGFTPFGAFGAFGFTPFGAFGAFGFTPFGAFGAFGFTPFGAFGAFGFTPVGHHSLAESTQVIVPGAPGGTKSANQLVVGDILLGLNIPNPANVDWTEWEVDSSSLSLSADNVVETQIVSINNTAETQFIYINGDLFSKSHYILVQKGSVTKFIKASDIDTSYKIFSTESKSFVDITLIDTVDITLNKISINCEPYDNFFTSSMLVFDRQDPVQ